MSISCLQARSRIPILNSKAMIQNRIEKLLSLICKWVLIVMPVLFVIGHVAADGVVCNYATRHTFDFMFDNLSSYASRSPVGWAIVACMLGFAYVLGFISWHAARCGPGLLSWVTAVAAAIGMINMVEVAWYPDKPNAEGFARMQEEFASKAPDTPRDAIGWDSLKITGAPVPQTLGLHEYLKSLRSYWLHDHGRKGAMGMILLAIAAARFLWQGDAARPRHHWDISQWMVMLWILTGLLIAWMVPSCFGLGQRVMYIGVYIWMWLIVQAIERKREGVEAEMLKC